MKLDRTAEASRVAAALGLSPDSIGRYARAGRIPFDLTPGKHRRFNIDEVRLALAEVPQASPVFEVPEATLRRRQRRAVVTPAAATADAATSHAASAAIEDLVRPAKRVLRAVVAA